MHKELLSQALEALERLTIAADNIGGEHVEGWQPLIDARDACEPVIASLRAALAEGEAEPVPEAYIARHYEELFSGGTWEWDAYTPEMYEERKDNPKFHDWTPLYTHPSPAALRAAVIEECARVVEVSATAAQAAAAIRAIKTKEPQ